MPLPDDVRHVEGCGTPLTRIQSPDLPSAGEVSPPKPFSLGSQSDSKLLSDAAQTVGETFEHTCYPLTDSQGRIQLKNTPFEGTRSVDPACLLYALLLLLLSYQV